MEMTLVSLNNAAVDGSIDEVIRVAEARQRKRLGAIADNICARSDVRIVLLSGASSAGKTTTATRLCTQLRVNDKEAVLVSTDDYFVGDKLNPRDENGNLDYEHIECVDIAKFTADMNALLSGETILRRRFDFQKHEGYISDEKRCLPSGGIIVIEGIHALNPRLCEGIDEKGRFGIFIDPVPSIDIFGGIKPKSRDARLLRRLVRDNRFRKMSPAETFRMWPNVIAGEEKWIEPFRNLADELFDSYLCYELAVLKPYAGGLLELARKELGEEKEIMNLIRTLNPVTAISSVSVPGDSILRETIGGSQLDY
jgi:uridine kinase